MLFPACVNSFPRVQNGFWYVFSPTTDLAVFLVKHGLEARATTAKMAVPRGYFARLNTYGFCTPHALPACAAYWRLILQAMSRLKAGTVAVNAPVVNETRSLRTTAPVRVSHHSTE